MRYGKFAIFYQYLLIFYGDIFLETTRKENPRR